MRALAVPTDVTDSGQVDLLFQRTIDEFGKVDVLINNAGMVGDQGGVPIWEITDEDFREGTDANFTGTFYCSRAVSRHMVEREVGTIINVSSGFGLRGGRDNYVYACAKGAVIQLTRTLATSLARYGVKSNCIVPGYFPTEGTSASKEVLPRAEFVPVGRVGEPAEIGPIAVFLASSASDYMNGETLSWMEEVLPVAMRLRIRPLSASRTLRLYSSVNKVSRDVILRSPDSAPIRHRGGDEESKPTRLYKVALRRKV